MELIVGCKKCKKVFKKDLTYTTYGLLYSHCFIRQGLEESDEYCPYCDNHFVIEASTPQPVIAVEGDDPRLIRDHRMKQSVIDDLDLDL